MLRVVVGKVLVRVKRTIIEREGGGYYRTTVRRWCGWEGLLEGGVKGSKKEGVLWHGVMFVIRILNLRMVFFVAFLIFLMSL